MGIFMEYDTEELSEETIKNIEKAKKEIKEGKYYTLEEIEKRLKIK